MDLSQESFGMDEDSEDKKTTNADSHWELSSGSRESPHYSSDSNEYFQASGGHELLILHKKETTLSRPLIPATKFEKLSFTRSYVTSSCKTEFTFTQQMNFSIFLWNYIYNVFGKSLPSSYLYVFLGSYAPEHHLFLTKMVPLCHGLNIFWIIVGLLQLIVFSMANVTFLDYAVCGMLYNNPWNRERIRYLDTPRFFGMSFTNFYIFFHFVLSSLLCNQIFKRNIWKAHALLHYTLTAIYAGAFVHLYYSTFDAEVTVMLPKAIESFMNADVDLLAESMTSPPVLHVLTSRSKQEVKIGTDTALLVTSNALYYIFRGLVEHELRKYCNFITNAPQLFAVGPALIFYWPLYLSNLYLGKLYTILFFYLVFFVEFCVFTITHQCLIEVFVCQWPCLNKWAGAIIILIMATILQSPLFGLQWLNSLTTVQLCGTNIITLAEITIICLIYPLGRLAEDITFHSGIAPTLFTTFILRAMFIHYLYKSTIMITNLKLVADVIEEKLKLVALLLLFSLSIGVILKFYKIVYKEKMNWTLIWRPDKYWGPSDVSSRWLRKKFKAEKYIASQAPRDLSRSLIRKAESKVYRLGLRYYNDAQRRSTQHSVTYRIKNEVM